MNQSLKPKWYADSMQNETDAKCDMFALAISLLITCLQIFFTEPTLTLSLVIGISVYITMRIVMRLIFAMPILSSPKSLVSLRTMKETSSTHKVDTTSKHSETEMPSTEEEHISEETESK